MTEIHVFPYRSDNYGFLIHLPKKQAVIAIDAGEDTPYLNAAEENGWIITHVLLTHHHDDHVSHAQALRKATGAKIWGPDGIGGLDQVIAVGALEDMGIQVFHTPGHTMDMLNFYIPEAKAVFTGDTLFTLGCGRLFEGTPDMMFESLKKLKALPEDTLVYGAHEYTLANLEFALSEFPDNEALQNRAEIIRALRDQGKPTVPSTLGAELATNPFLLAQNAQEFARLRAAKDAF